MVNYHGLLPTVYYVQPNSLLSHPVRINFGFMLCNMPGNMCLEAAPFKLPLFLEGSTASHSENIRDCFMRALRRQ